ncbi:Aminotransferase class V domain-containing protein, partial [Dysosmobacter welbionis]
PLSLRRIRKMCQPPPEAGIPPLLTVVGRHGPDGRVVPHHDQKLSCTGQGRVQHSPHHQGRRCRHGRQHHALVLAALGLVDRHGIGQIDLIEHIQRVRGDPVIKVHHQQLSGRVDLHDPSHVSVEHAGAHGAVRLFPYHVVVVFRLHDPVSGAEQPLSPLDLPFVRRRRVQRRLKTAVQILRAAGPLPGGRQHLDLVRRDAHVVRQPGFAQLHHRGEGPLPIPAAEEEEVSLVVGQLGRLAQVHRVGVADDGRLLRLAEHLPEEHRLHPAAADQVGEHVSRPHGGQLVRIPHQHQPGAGPQGPQQSGKQRQVHHGHLIHDHRVRLQRLLFRLLERHLMGDVVPAHPQHPVDRLGLHAGQLAHALGRPPGGGRQDDLQAHPPEQGHDA